MAKETHPVVFMLAVWGENYIRQFFEFGLRALLAPGNIPAMSEEYTCTFLFLTLKNDVPFFKAQAEYSLLASYCKIEFIEISDLMFDKNYSATLTLAYERGIRSRGKMMCQTYFFCFVSDYILANGSLKNLMHYLKAGYNGITTGNFLVVEEYIADKILEIREANQGIISISPREMLKLAMPNIHPVSTSQTVTQSFTHALHANRLFWKINDQMIIGRFYLRHMLCIKPESETYVIGSSCDYSFIPEMCPSGRVAHIQDSDEYCLIEMAPFEYERQFIETGPFEIQKLAEHFSEWTTPVHRANAYFPVVYHIDDLKEEHLAAVRASEKYIKEIEKHLDRSTQPIRGHVYWLSCIESMLHASIEKKEENRQKSLFFNILNSPVYAPPFSSSLDDCFVLKASHPPASMPLKKIKKKERIKAKLAGKSLGTSIWNVQWLDDFVIRKNLHAKITQHDKSVFIAFEPIREIVCWLEKQLPQSCVFQYYNFFTQRTSDELQKIFSQKRHVIIWLTEGYFFELAHAIRISSKFLAPDSKITVYFRQKKVSSKKVLRRSLDICNADLSHVNISHVSFQTFHSISRGWLQAPIAHYSEKFFAPGKRLRTRVVGVAGLVALNGLCILGNLFSLLIKSKKKCTSAIIDFSLPDGHTIFKAVGNSKSSNG